MEKLYCKTNISQSKDILELPPDLIMWIEYALN